MKYFANDRTSIEQLVVNIRKLPKREKIDLMIFLTINRLIIAPFMVRVGMWIASTLKGETGLHKFLLTLFDHDELLNTSITNTLHHILYGKDTIDRDSVGGFSQRELNDIVKFFPEL